MGALSRGVYIALDTGEIDCFLSNEAACRDVNPAGWPCRTHPLIALSGRFCVCDIRDPWTVMGSSLGGALRQG